MRFEIDAELGFRIALEHSPVGRGEDKLHPDVFWVREYQKINEPSSLHFIDSLIYAF